MTKREMIATSQDETCRGCRRRLRRFIDEMKPCFYGGWVCSRLCDVRTCVQLESDMPGAGIARRPGDLSMREIRANWDD